MDNRDATYKLGSNSRDFISDVVEPMKHGAVLMTSSTPAADKWKKRLALKITLLGLGAALPLLASAIFFLRTFAGHEITFTERERMGLRCAQPMMHVLIRISEHQDLASTATPGGPELFARLGTLGAEIDRAFAEFARRSHQLDDLRMAGGSRASSSVAGLLDAQAEAWRRLQRDLPQLDFATRIERHGQILDGMQRAMRALGDRSNLILDPELDSYNFASALTQSLPTIQFRRSAAASTVMLWSTETRIAENDRRRLAVLSILLRDTAASRLLAELHDRKDLDSGTEASLDAGERFATTQGAFLDLLDRALASDSPGALARDTARASAEWRVAGASLWEMWAQQLDHQLQNRLQHLRRNSNLNLFFIGLALVASTGLTVGVGRSIFVRTRRQQQAEADVRRLNAELETRVAERTAQLQKFARAIEQSPAMVMITDPRGVIEFVNPRFTGVTGYTVEESIGRRPGELIRSGRHPVTFYEDLWQTIQAGRPWHGEVCNRRKNGELFWEQMSVASLRDDAGAVTHYIAVMEDVTERIRAREILHAAKAQAESANRAKTTFLANMSHEIRTPMNAILGFAQLMMRDPGLTAPQEEHLRVIGRNGEHLMELIDDILEMSKIEANRVTLNRAPFDLGVLVRDLESMFRVRVEGKGLGFKIECGEDLPACVVGDEGKLRQILINLLGNAVKFTDQGSVVLRLRATAIDRSGWHVRAEVADTGPGVPKSEQSRLFQPFVQTELGRKAGSGTGLGLAISREFARMMDGDITLESEEGRGAVFRVDVALDRAEGRQPLAIRATDARGHARLAPGQPAVRVLVADDLEDNRKFLCQLLRDAGFEVAEAINGAAAVAEFGRWQPHCILMDLRMPVMDGVEATRQIRSREQVREVKIIALSASVFAQNREHAMEVGADDFLGKPFHESDLFEKLGALLGVKYEYHDSAMPAGATEIGPEEVLNPLPPVPPEIVLPLRQAIEEADLDRVLLLIESIEEQHPRAAGELRKLAQAYDYPRLVARLEA